jgi:Raf kinase inhibitor-like YbhB/YbcL family protein
MKKIADILVACAFVFFCTGVTDVVCAQTKGGAGMITITSTAFTDSAMIPRDYTCDGSNVSPPLSWSGLPEGTKSFALICDDPDAPMGTWVHWVLFNLPASVTGLPRAVPTDRTLANGARHGINDFRKYGYGGPCPPGGTHRYYFKIYALDAEITHEPGISKEALLTAMQGHILAEGRLMGRYKR